jgi:hypothetical protein
MKKISKTIAMILVLVMVAGSFTGCLSYWLITGEPLDISGSGKAGFLIIMISPIVDIIVLPIALTVCIVKFGMETARDNRGRKWDGIDTFSATVKALPHVEFNSLMHKFDALPESELDVLAYKFYSLPEKEIDAYSQTLSSFSEKEIAVMTQAVNSLPEVKIISLMKTLNSMPEEKFISAMNKLQFVKFRCQYKRAEQ